MKRAAILALFLLASSLAYSTSVSIHIYSDKTFSSVIFAPSEGNYILEGNDKKIDTCNTSGVYEISVLNDSMLQVKNLDHIIGTFSRLRFRGYGANNQFYLKPSEEKTKRLFSDDLVLIAEKANLRLVNILDLERYVAGVVQCEAGLRKPYEYYKVQAIICRTYALNNLARHIDEGFELCDLVHCQVYQGDTHNSDILKAVEATKGLVLVDENNQLINAAFHSNCGGQTINSEDVWNKPLPYLRAREDTFCIHGPAARWQKQITLKEWKNYLAKKEETLKKDPAPAAHWDSIPVGRRVYLYDKGYLIPLKDIRTDWNLHSTYFTITKEGENIVLNGRGYGHRVGLCQEGAIHMSQTGYNYEQILHFYYNNVQLINYSILFN
ncbi:MAG: SpoIID/LytB domain-containing protein [Bacteroidia bacterium]